MTAAKSSTKSETKPPKAAMATLRGPRGRILTGHRPTGPRHIGHLVGTLEQWAKMQDDYECFFLIADIHVLTTDYEHPKRIQSNIADVMIDWLAAGLDPAKSTFVRQSPLIKHSRVSTPPAPLL